MCRYNKGITFCFLLLLCFACTKPKETADINRLTIVSGKVHHMEVYPTTKELFVEVVDFSARISMFKGSINVDGTFRIAFDLYAPQDIIMRPLVNKLILHPGDSIFIDLDFKDIGNVRFSGDRAETNLALQKYLWSNAGIANYSSHNLLGIDAYKPHCDSVRADAFLKQEKFINEFHPPKDFIQWSTDFVNINYYQSLFTFPYRYYSRNEEGFLNWFDSTAYYDFMNDIETDFSDFGKAIVHTDIYKLIAYYRSVISMKLSNKLPEGKVLQIEDVIDEFLKTHTEVVFKEMLLGNVFHGFLATYNIDKFNELKTIFDENIKESFIKQPLTDLYNNFKNPKIGSDAIFASMGAEGMGLLNSIIAENKGKVLFIDLWATWCSPCIDGMKTAKEIMPMYENQDIEFIYLCINSTEENWQATLSKLEIGGQHYFCNSKQGRDISSALRVEGIPHYFIVNKNGHIVQPKSYGLASSQEIIDKLLKENVSDGN
jgi:thiol-disulfide isomerase/thioredoxin